MKLAQKVVVIVINLITFHSASAIFLNLQIDSNDKRLEREGIVSILPLLEPRILLQKYSDSAKVASICDRDLRLYFTAVEKLEPWALQMVDASSKIPSGILAGNIVDFGMYDECISIQGNFSTIIIRGKHCFYTLDIISARNGSLRFYPKLSMCIPSSCDTKNVVSIINGINEFIHQTRKLADFNIRVKATTCSSSDPKKWSTGSILTLTMIILLIILLLFCTILEFCQRWIKLRNPIIRILGQFSLFNSSLKILSCESNPGMISSIHGIRALSILWIIYGHAIQFSMTSFVNMIDFGDFISSRKCIYLAMGLFSVDTFLLLSGFLLSFIFLKKKSKDLNFNVFFYYFHRYMRLTPPMAILILIATYIAPHLGSGPNWDVELVENVSHQCEVSWWKFLLYVQNYAGDSLETMKCMGHLWYLSVDMQLFLLSPLILYPLSKKPIIGLAIWGIFFLASIITPAAIVATKKLTFKMLAIQDERLLDSIREIYISTHSRASPWLFGIFFGYLLAKKDTKPKRIFLCVGWAVAIICFVFCTWGFSIMLSKDYEYEVVFEALFASLSHFIWTIGVFWIIYVCYHGYGGIMSKFLSLPIFLPISRLSYCLYLSHYLVQTIKSNTVRVPNYFSEFSMFLTFLSDAILCLVISFFFCIFFESPFIILEKVFLGETNLKWNKAKEQTQNNEQIRTKDREDESYIEGKLESEENDFENHSQNGNIENLKKGVTIIDPSTQELTTIS